MRLALALLALVVLVPAAAGAPTARDYDPVFSPDGRTIAFVHGSGSAASIRLVATTGGRPRTLVPQTLGAQYLAWSPDGTSIAYSDRYDVWRVDVATRKLVRLTGDESSQANESLQPSWSPDGTTIAYTRFQDCFRCTAIWLVDADGANLRPIYEKSLGRRPTFSPDGTKLALSLAADTVIDLQGNTVVPSQDEAPAYTIWSPKGVYVAWTGGGLWVHDLQTGTTRRVTTRVGAQIAWSPDGKWIAGGAKGRVALVLARDGTHLRTLPASATASVPSFSHGLLAYVHAGACGIDLAREDGSRIRRLTKSC